jgi:hypothetical protein
MAEQDKDRNLDNLLDSLLARYSDAQPRPGLETRVMAQLREQAGRKKSWKWSLSWMWAGAAAAALITVVFIVRVERPIESPEPPIFHADWSLLHHSDPSVVQPPRAGISVTTAQRNGHTPQPHHQELAVAADTRPDVFPTPAPLSDQEKLLLRYLARTARHEIVAQSHPDEPVETAEPFLLQIQLPTRTEFNNSTR